MNAVRRIPGEAGVWLFILGDMVAFALMFGVLVWTEADDPALYAAGQSELTIAIGVVNTLILLTSSLVVALAVRAARGPQAARAAPLLAGAMGCAVAFATLKAVEYIALASDDVTGRSGDFFTYYFTFTGIHLLHVTIGLVVLTAVRRMVRRSRGALDGHEMSLVESGASYWHMVDLLWIVLFALLYLHG